MYAFISLTLSTATSAPWLDASQSLFKMSPPVPFKLSALVEGDKTEFGFPVALTDKSPKSMNFGIFLMTELANFISLLESILVTTSTGRRFKLTTSV